MSWLSDFLEHLKPSCRWEHFMAKIAGEEELENDYIPSSREEGFLYKIAQKTNSGGSGGTMYTTITRTPDAYVFDKTYAELKAAYDSGNLLVAMYTGKSALMSYREMGGRSAFLASFLNAQARDGSIITLETTNVGIMNDETVMGEAGTRSF